MAGNEKNDEQSGEAGWYKGEAAGSPAPTDGFADSSFTPHQSDAETVEWTASEFVAHDKSFGWFALLAIIAVAIAALLYLITRDTFSAGTVLILAVILGVAGARKPRIIAYRVDQSGLTAGNRHYPFREYKSFAIPDDDGPFASIVLIPLKRFGFPVSAYLAPDSEEKVVDVIADHLPMEQGKMDAVERLMRQLRF